MRKGDLTREQAIAAAGVELVDKLDGINCEPTGRVGYNGACQDNDFTEWAASIKFVDQDGNERSLTAYYYTSNDDDDRLAEYGDINNWEIDGYEIW